MAIKKIHTNIYIAFCVGLVLCSCSKTIKIKTQTLSMIKYIKPEQCKIETYKNLPYHTQIIKNYIAFDKENIDLFLKNFQNYAFYTSKYIRCLEKHEEYYQNILTEILK